MQKALKRPPASVCSDYTPALQRARRFHSARSAFVEKKEQPFSAAAALVQSTTRFPPSVLLNHPRPCPRKGRWQIHRAAKNPRRDVSTAFPWRTLRALRNHYLCAAFARFMYDDPAAPKGDRHFFSSDGLTEARSSILRHNKFDRHIRVTDCSMYFFSAQEFLIDFFPQFNQIRKI